MIGNTGKVGMKESDSQSIFLADAVSSITSSTRFHSLADKRRSHRSIDDNQLLDSKSESVTVETAVFIDESLYDIMKKTFAGLFRIVVLMLLLFTCSTAFFGWIAFPVFLCPFSFIVSFCCCMLHDLRVFCVCLFSLMMIGGDERREKSDVMWAAAAVLVVFCRPVKCFFCDGSE